MASQMAQQVKNQPAMQEMQIRSLRRAQLGGTSHLQHSLGSRFTFLLSISSLASPSIRSKFDNFYLSEALEASVPLHLHHPLCLGNS